MAKHLPHIVIIAGPTASGKTAAALALARHLPIEVVSADSRQIFRHLSIGTAKPSPEELQSVRHHFIDHCDPDERFTAGDFQEQGRTVIAEILRKGKIPVVVGGTGLYIQAVVDGFFEQPKISGATRTVLEQRLESEGKESLFRELERVDPRSAAGMDASKYRRVIRALEVYYETGKPISEFHREHAVVPVYTSHFFGLEWDRSELYERINRRAEGMIAAGLLKEVEQLRQMGFDDRYQSLQTVGYKEAFAFVRNEIDKKRMIELIQQNTRRFAKRQMTWFRKEKRIRWLSCSGTMTAEETAGHILRHLPAALTDKG